MNMQMSKVCNQ